MNHLSLIIAGRNQKQREEMLQNVIKEHSINKFDVTMINPGEQRKSQTIGIEDVRVAQDKLYLSPLKGKTKAVVFSASAITIEAQNALLKILEEPPENTIIILSFPNADLLLPTIISRVKVIKVKSDEDELAKENSLLNLQSLGVGEKLKKAQDLGKDKETALDFLLSEIKLLRKELYKSVLEENDQQNSLSNYHSLLTRLNQTYTTIATTNVNPRFALESLFLSL